MTNANTTNVQTNNLFLSVNGEMVPVTYCKWMTAQIHVVYVNGKPERVALSDLFVSDEIVNEASMPR